MDLIRPFAVLSRADLPLAGGKGANLGELTRAGLPVPPGFVLLTPAYRAFVAANGLQPEIERLAATGENASAAIRALFDGGALPAEVAEAVRAAYAELGAGVVAVRSSATAEDLPGASFAGQQETYLNIEGADAVLDAVRRCWSSLWTARAISYRVRQAIAPGDVALAVVIQRQVNADAAGVLFTVNPVTGHRGQMVVDGAWGLGEAVVSGQVTPDHWVLDAASGAVLSADVAEKAVMTVRVADGGVELASVPADLQRRPALDDRQLAELAALGRQVAAYYGEPQDIEWALADGQFDLVQSRPITSLFPMPEPMPPAADGLRLYLSANYLQGFTEPITPMGIDFFALLGNGMARLWGFKLTPGEQPPAMKTAALRLYIDIGGGLRHPFTRRLVQLPPRIIDNQMERILTGLLARERRLDPDGRRRPLRVKPGAVLWLLSRLVRTAFAPDRARDSALRDVWAYVNGLEAAAGRLHGVEERVRFVRENAPRLIQDGLAPLATVVFPGVAMRFLAEAKVKAWLGDVAGLQPVYRGLAHNPTTEMDLALWRVSRGLAAGGAAPRADHPAVADFLRQYGHRGVREIDMGMPRWRDDPAHVLGVLETYLARGAEADAEAHFRTGAAAAERSAAEVVGRVKREKGPVRAWALRWVLKRFRALGGTREYPKFFLVKVISIYRQVLQGAGAELAAAGQLDRPDDIFFLHMRDLLIKGADLRALAAAGRAEYRRELDRRAVPRVITSEGELFYGAPAPAVPGALAGTAASPGICEGVVRVVHDPTNARLEPGEVLVAPGTDPAWTPLFLAAGALVMEVGGVMSHGSVVAREYGIPAVVGVAGATEQLKTGQRVRVDGEAGVVIPLS